jgi:hypothetical protein
MHFLLVCLLALINFRPIVGPLSESYRLRTSIIDAQKCLVASWIWHNGEKTPCVNQVDAMECMVYLFHYFFSVVSWLRFLYLDLTLTWLCPTIFFMTWLTWLRLPIFFHDLTSASDFFHDLTLTWLGPQVKITWPDVKST